MMAVANIILYIVEEYYTLLYTSCPTADLSKFVGKIKVSNTIFRRLQISFSLFLQM